MSNKLVTGVCRVRYPHLIEPRQANDDGKAAWSISLLIPKSDKETVKKIKAAQEAAIEKKFKGKRPSKFDDGLRDGDADAEDKGEAYLDHWYINAKNYQNAPGVIDRHRRPLTDATDVVDGDYCKLAIEAYGYDTRGNRGVAWGLRSVLFWEKGEPLGHVARPEDEFADDLEPATAGDDDDDDDEFL